MVSGESVRQREEVDGVADGQVRRGPITVGRAIEHPEHVTSGFGVTEAFGDA